MIAVSVPTLLLFSLLGATLYRNSHAGGAAIHDVRQGSDDSALTSELAPALLTEDPAEKIPDPVQEETTEVAEEAPRTAFHPRSEDAAYFAPGYHVSSTPMTYTVPEDYEQVNSPYAVLVDLDQGTIVAAKDAGTVIYPASMTKILTLLVASEHITDLDDTFVITREITDYVYTNGCSAVNWEVGEEVTVRDLLYGTILPSGADAALALAEYVAGSQEVFVAMMNAKVLELGLSSTAHFTNVIGIHDELNHCTVTDMAMIMKAAMEDALCREVMQAHTYTTSATPEHPEGILISNWFLRRIEDKETPGVVWCAKTGFVNESASCAASYFISDDGGHYVCVTAGAHSSWRCIYDHVELYNLYIE